MTRQAAVGSSTCLARLGHNLVGPCIPEFSFRGRCRGWWCLGSGLVGGLRLRTGGLRGSRRGRRCRGDWFGRRQRRRGRRVAAATWPLPFLQDDRLARLRAAAPISDRDREQDARRPGQGTDNGPPRRRRPPHLRRRGRDRQHLHQPISLQLERSGLGYAGRTGAATADVDLDPRALSGVEFAVEQRLNGSVVRMRHACLPACDRPRPAGVAPSRASSRPRPSRGRGSRRFHRS